MQIFLVNADWLFCKFEIEWQKTFRNWEQISLLILGKFKQIN